MTATDTPAVSVRNKVGLVIAGLLGIVDVVGPFTTPHGDGTVPGPPMAVLVACAVLGVITLVAVVLTWRTGDRAGSRVVAGSRILAALTSVPAFFVPDVPAALVALAAGGVVVTLVSCWLVLARPSVIARA